MNELVILSQCAVAAVLLLASVNVNGLETAQGEMCGMNQCMMHHRSRLHFYLLSYNLLGACVNNRNYDILPVCVVGDK